ncbi:MAG: T9SS type A sorting domain-containing protein, partial [Bacteroidota bacterium]
SIRCVLTSNATCASSASVSSSTIHMVVNPILTPTISITPNPNDTVCAGTSVTYTATITNGGATPTYQWKKNGANAGTNNSTYTYTPNNLDSVRCILTSNAMCASPTTLSSNTVNMTVNPVVTPSIAITVSPYDTLCADSLATFTASITNGGTAPIYQWEVNSLNVGTNANTYSYVPLNGDQVFCVLSSNAACASSSIAMSNTINLTVDANVAPTVTISGATVITTGSTQTYTATVNVSGTVTYQWQVNGVNVGTNTSTYTYTPNDSDILVCNITVSGAGCYIGNWATNKITIYTTEGITQLSGNSPIHIYPNPTNDVLHIDNLKFSTDYRIVNIIGLTVQEGTLQAGSNVISTESFSNGFYLLELTDNQGARHIVRMEKE